MSEKYAILRIVVFKKVYHFCIRTKTILKMKDLFITILVLSTVLVFGQAETQKDILDIPNTDLVKDFNYKTSNKTPVVIFQKWFTKSNNKYNHVTSSEYIFDKKSLNLKKKRYKRINGFDNYWTVYNYSYKKNLLQNINITKNKKIIENSIFSYNNANKIIFKKNKFGDFVEDLNYTYPDTNTIIKTNKKTDTKTGIILLDFKTNFTIVNNHITKEIIAKPKLSKEYITNFKYDNHNLLIKISPYEKFLGTFTPSSSPTIVYKYNDSGYLISELSVTGIDDIKQLHFEYIYDDYDNWIAKFKIFQKDIYDSKSKVITEIKIRTIKYSDNTTTGFTNIDNPKINDYLESKKFVISKPPSIGEFWSKQDDKSFIIFENGKNISAQFNFVKLLNDNFYVNDSIKNTVYQINGFSSKPVLKEYYKATIFAQKDEGIWYKNKKDEFWLIVNGKYLKELTVRIATTNKNNRIIYINKTPKYVLLYKDANPFEMQKAVAYNDYLKNNPNEGKKEVAKNIPSGAIWEKASNGGFWFYYNGENRNQKINYLFFGNHCVVYDPTNKKSYLLKNIKTEKINNFINAKVLDGNKFWYKSKPKYFIYINNGKVENPTNIVYAQNGIDVIINDSNSQKYILKDYNNKPLLTLFPVMDYTSYTENSDATNTELKALKNCGDDGKCFVKLFDKKVTSINNDTSILNKPKELSYFLIKVYKANPRMLQKVVFLTKEENQNIYLEAKELLPKELQKDIEKRSREMLNNYNKHMNSKEVKEKVKKYGGEFINK